METKKGVVEDTGDRKGADGNVVAMRCEVDKGIEAIPLHAECTK